MELEKENIHQLAVHYFEGRITLQEEEELFRFVNACADNYEMFRRWEKEWMQSATRGASLASASLISLAATSTPLGSSPPAKERVHQPASVDVSCVEVYRIFPGVGCTPQRTS